MENQSEQLNDIKWNILQTGEQKKSLGSWIMSISFGWGGEEKGRMEWIDFKDDKEYIICRSGWHDES